jgi:hypothetical protein
MTSQKCARDAPATAGSDPRIAQLPGRLSPAKRPSPQYPCDEEPDTWQPLGVAARNALSRLIGGRDA